MKTMLSVIALAALATPAVAHACSPASPPIATTAEEIAANGVLIRGRLIQAFDPDREAPEIIEVEEVYVGDSKPEAFVIYRPKSDFAEARKLREPREKNDPPLVCGPFFDHEVEMGKAF